MRSGRWVMEGSSPPRVEGEGEWKWTRQVSLAVLGPAAVTVMVEFLSIHVQQEGEHLFRRWIRANGLSGRMGLYVRSR